MKIINCLSRSTYFLSRSHYCCVAIILFLSINFANATVLYSNDFDGNTSVDAGVTAVGFTNGTLEATIPFGNWSGNYFDNRSTGNPALMSTLTLTGLAAHTTVDINLLLGFLESWDSSPGDLLDFYIDGALVASLTSNNAGGAVEHYAGGTELLDDAQINTNFFFDDTLVDMSTAGFLNIAHNTPTLTLGIQASGNHWQGGSDEGWGIDAVVIDYDRQSVPVPAPESLTLFGFALLGIAVSRKKRQKSLC